MLERNKNSI